MRDFENHVQFIKYKVLKEVARGINEGNLEQILPLIPERIIKGPKAETRCCIYKERAIINERVKLALGGNQVNDNVIEVIDMACDDCPVNKYIITNACRGCLAHKCQTACKFDAIQIVNHQAIMDFDKCKECGKCVDVCPYNAIAEVQRPCIRACKTDAITYDPETKKASIHEEDCIQCGACVYQCPFGAIMDKSQIVEITRSLMQKERKVYGIVAPAISSQFTYASIEQVVAGVKALGFHSVVEAALGADIVAYFETQSIVHELDHMDFVTTSCCPAFVNYIQKKFPQLADNISDMVSPMVAMGRLIKSTDPNAITVFIGPCIAKKMEAKATDITDAIDYVMTFEELQALLDAKEIDVATVEKGVLDNASFYGRIFARTGGVSEAIAHVAGILYPEMTINALACDGLEECKKALTLGKLKKLPYQILEGMACKGGCICGPASLSHGPKDKGEVDRYAKLSIEKDVASAIRVLNLEGVNLKRGL